MRFLIFCLFFFVGINLHAQKVSEFVKKIQEEYQMQPAQVECKTLIKDDLNGYMKVLETSVYRSEKVINCHEYGLWKWTKGYFFGDFYSQTIYQQGKFVSTKTSDNGSALSINLVFRDQNNQMTDIYPKEEIAQYFDQKLAEITAKGAEGSEVLFAQIPQKGTSIKLYIVYASELKSNNGTPIWKYDIGELQFDKNKGIFKFKKA